MKDFLDFIKLPSHLLGALAIASGILLFAPNKVIQLLYMTNFRNTYGFIIGIVFITSVSILLILVIKRIYKHINNECQAKKLKESQEKYLKDLDYEKTSLIISFLREPTHTISLPMQDGRVIELQYYNVITPAGSTHLVSMPNPQIIYFLQPWVKARINENSELRAKFIV